jgi:hypothetical protein
MAQYAPDDIIDRAIAYSQQAYNDFKTQNFGITEGLTPKAWHGIMHLRLRNDLNRGCREASKLIPINWKRSVGFSILMKAVNDIFQYHNYDFTKQTYNETLKRYGIISP